MKKPLDKKECLDKKGCIELIVNAFYRVASELQSFSKLLRADHGVTDPQLRLLQLVGHFENTSSECKKARGITASELSGQLHLHLTTVSGIVDRLETAGFIVRERSKTDRRKVKLHLTEEGQNLTERVPLSGLGRLACELEKLSDYEVRQIYKVMKRLVEMVGKR